VANATTLRQHPNAPLTVEGRRRMVACVLDHGWTIEATAGRFQVDAKTVRKWRDRYVAAGDAGLQDRSCRPHRSPNRTPRQLRRRVLRLRRRRRWGADHIGFEVGLAASTVQGILNAAGVGRLDRGDRATDTRPVRRYQRDTPGELIHVDIKKLAGIPDGGGWRTRGRGYKGDGATTRRAGYRYIHTAVDDRSRIAYSEILDDEQAVTAAGFWRRAAAWYQAIGIQPQRVITDNGSCYRSGLWHRACAATGTTVKKTRPRRPQTNGKVERFHRILLEEWAYIRPWTSETQRADAYVGFIHFYNHHRAHGALGWATPTSIIQDNLPEEHT
jgi:transposase InsO family protein